MKGLLYFGHNEQTGDYYVDVEGTRLTEAEALELYHFLGQWLVAVNEDHQREADKS